MDANDFIAKLDDQPITEAIQQAEATTSGEIRVFISSQLSETPLDDARKEFHKLGMTRTPGRNAILLFFAPKSGRFALFGDEAIYLRADSGFWSEVTGEMEVLLRAGKLGEAVLLGIRRAGAELSRHFPKNPGDRNDLPDTVVRD
ncbi:MAG TPA: TPM domain-containing protein [Verrucomicrobiota bacterium]|nr:TPM domain-containing protein [Verrucomicrobiota bacterium]